MGRKLNCLLCHREYSLYDSFGLHLKSILNHLEEKHKSNAFEIRIFNGKSCDILLPIKLLAFKSMLLRDGQGTGRIMH